MTKDSLISRLRDIAERNPYELCATRFLTPTEQAEAFSDRSNAFLKRLYFWGGFHGAQRRIGFFIPEWIDGDLLGNEASTVDSSNERSNASSENFIFSRKMEETFLTLCDAGELCPENMLSYIRISGSGFSKLTHRDYLGAVLNLGIERSAVGDIAPLSDSCCILICQPSVAPLITGELCRVGRDGVRAECISADRELEVVQSFEDISVTVASMRLDCLVKALCNVSREDAQSMVLSGSCFLNMRECSSCDRSVFEGDILSIRGYGKYIVSKKSGETKKSRIRLSVKKYI